MRSWISAHIYYHDSLDGLIAGAARPLVDELRARALIEAHFFVRYWQGGPHLRLRLLPRAATDAAVVAAALEDRLTAFLRANPSQTVLRDDDYLRVAQPLAAVEPGARAVEPLEPNNTVRRRVYEPEYDRYGGTPDAMAVVERHFTESSEIAFDVLAAAPTRDQRTAQALSMLFVAVAEGDDGRAEWGPRRMFGDVGRQEAHFEAHYQRQRPRLRDLARRLRALVGGAPADDANPIARWLRSVRRLAADLRDLERAGRFAQDRGAAIRSCSHMHNNRLGISLPEEAYLRYLVWRIVTDRTPEEQS